VNGKFIDTRRYRNIIGYVDQEDTLMDTLTVYEIILDSALLRLPRDMPLAVKKRRVQETMMELGIVGIANRRIGNTESRGISGGEKRRVSIACELVTSPSIIFLDEPTSGLDSYNAYNVIECLVSLARDYNRCVVLTIHQPRSNIYALFDKLLLLAKGRMVYSGPAQQEAIDHFSRQGFECPKGFNIADYLGELKLI
jgi:ABC-type multidrug transport system ATPase subunit